MTTVKFGDIDNVPKGTNTTITITKEITLTLPKPVKGLVKLLNL